MPRTEFYPSEVMDRFLVRLPDGLRDRIKLAAHRNNRSMNAEVVAILEERFPPVPFDPRSAIELIAFIREGHDAQDKARRAALCRVELAKVHPGTDVSTGEDGQVVITAKM